MDARAMFVQDTWNAKKFVSAVKGDSINKYADIPVPIGGPRKRLTEENKDEAIEWFAQMVARQFVPSDHPRLVVPVPAHDATTPKQVRESRLWRLAVAVAKELSCTPVVGVHWKNPLKRARDGGERDAVVLKNNTVVLNDAVSAGEVLLLDDVVTSGGHLVGCASALRDAGADVLAALCVGRTVDEQAAAPFSWSVDKYVMLTSRSDRK